MVCLQLAALGADLDVRDHTIQFDDGLGEIARLDESSAGLRDEIDDGARADCPTFLHERHAFHRVMLIVGQRHGRRRLTPLCKSPMEIARRVS